MLWAIEAVTEVINQTCIISSLPCIIARIKAWGFLHGSIYKMKLILRVSSSFQCSTLRNDNFSINSLLRWKSISNILCCRWESHIEIYSQFLLVPTQEILNSSNKWKPISPRWKSISSILCCRLKEKDCRNQKTKLEVQKLKPKTPKPISLSMRPSSNQYIKPKTQFKSVQISTQIS